MHFNHRSERHLAASALAAACARPAVLITDASNALALSPDRGGAAHERELVDLALAALRQDGAGGPQDEKICVTCGNIYISCTCGCWRELDGARSSTPTG